MTRRDYLLIAAAFERSLHGDAPITFEMRVGIERAARDMAYTLAQANPRFEQETFLRNAGVI